ncbi:MAG: hypothetical protein OEU36_15730 [Gammaproteobacteria bacterium]|nr:hypothetical protein [Gammaproteobacteria bacterium]
MEGGVRAAPGATAESNAGIDTRMYRSRVMQDAITERLPKRVSSDREKAVFKCCDWITVFTGMTEPSDPVVVLVSRGVLYFLTDLLA